MRRAARQRAARQRQPRRWAVAAVLAVLVGWVPLPPAAAPAYAAPVRTVLAAEGGDGAWQFLSDLAALWRNQHQPTNERLVLRSENDPARRLRAVSRDRADFAVVDAATAAEGLREHPRLAVVAVLWPNLLHAVSRNPRVEALGVPLPEELWVLDSAAFVHRVLRDLTRGDTAQRKRLHAVPERVLVDALDYAERPVLLFAAPVPAAELVAAQRRNASLRLLPFAGRLLEELQLAYPWLTTEKLGRGAYPAQRANLELPGVHQVLVGRRGLPAATVRKVLSTVYGRANAMALFDPLFGQTDGRMNAVYGKLMPFHPATAQRFGFEPAAP